MRREEKVPGKYTAMSPTESTGHKSLNSNSSYTGSKQETETTHKGKQEESNIKNINYNRKQLHNLSKFSMVLYCWGYPRNYRLEGLKSH